MEPYGIWNRFTPIKTVVFQFFFLRIAVLPRLGYSSCCPVRLRSLRCSLVETPNHSPSPTPTSPSRQQNGVLPQKLVLIDKLNQSGKLSVPGCPRGRPPHHSPAGSSLCPLPNTGDTQSPGTSLNKATAATERAGTSSTGRGPGQIRTPPAADRVRFEHHRPRGHGIRSDTSQQNETLRKNTGVRQTQKANRRCPLQVRYNNATGAQQSITIRVRKAHSGVQR